MRNKQRYKIWVCGNRNTIAKHFEGSMDNVIDLPDLEWADMFIKSLEGSLYFQIKNRIEKSKLNENDIQIRIETDEMDEYHNHLWVCSKILPRELRQIVNDSIDWQLNMLQEVMDVTKTEPKETAQ
tara:strand:- start:5223 stop:5600 length:378 start_codon:yes stop_codon:yes gene_type:complete